MTKKQEIDLDDVAVVYYSDEDECWIAHGLHTDQLGTGARLLDAVADFIKAIHQLCDLATADGTVAYRREAPPEIQEMSSAAKPLPREIFEIAHKMVHGTWPDYLSAPDVKNQTDDESYRLEVPEKAVCC